MNNPTHLGMQSENVDGTVIFLSKMIEFWKIVNVKSLPMKGARLKDATRDAILSEEKMIYVLMIA